MQRTTTIAALAHESRKSLILLQAMADARAPEPARPASDPLNAIILRRRRSAAALRSLLRAEGRERTLPPLAIPQQVDTDSVIAAEAMLLAFLDRQLARADLADDLRQLADEMREDVLQATLVLSRLRDLSR